jgi:lysozyme family protein
MMALTTQEIIAAIIKREGGFSNRPADRGGPTKYGITQQTLSEWRGQKVSAAEVADMSEAEAIAIYTTRYVNEPAFDKLQAEEIRDDVVDIGVNHGTLRAAQWLQEIAGVKIDGVLGPKSLAAINAMDPHVVARRLTARRARFYGQIIATDAQRIVKEHGIHSQGENAGGWLNRVAEFIEQL